MCAPPSRCTFSQRPMAPILTDGGCRIRSPLSLPLRLSSPPSFARPFFWGSDGGPRASFCTYRRSTISVSFIFRFGQLFLGSRAAAPYRSAFLRAHMSAGHRVSVNGRALQFRDRAGDYPSSDRGRDRQCACSVNSAITLKWRFSIQFRRA